MSPKTLSSVLTAIALVTIFFIPDPVLADHGSGFVPCHGSDCAGCHFVVLGQNVLNWLFGIVFLIFGVIAVVAGFGLVTSGGNQSKLDDAKSKLSNALIGLLIVFAAWLVVDTLMKAALGGNGNINVGGMGPWYEISCDATAQRPAGG